MAGRAKVQVQAGPPAHLVQPWEDMTDDQKAKVRLAGDNGIVNPVWAMQAALWADGVPYFVLCAYLEQESAGGKNVWGSDPTWMRGVELRAAGLGDDVTEDRYKVYKLHRDRTGEGGFGNQGVGPMQLTHPTFQSRADALGGCWLPLPNMQAAAGWLGEQRGNGLDWHTIAARYNNSEAYAVHNDELRARWKAILAGGPQGFGEGGYGDGGFGE